VRSRFLLPYLLTALITAAGGLAAQTSGSVSGTVLGRFDNDVRPLPFALVEAWGGTYRRSVVADSLGRYQLVAVPAGTLHLRVTHAGHDPVVVDVVVPTEGPVLVDLELRARPVRLPPVEVTTDVRVPDPDPKDVEAGLTTRVDAAALEIGSGAADAGLVDAVRALGGNDPGQATDVLFMRGSTTDLKLVLLDGAPVYTPFHVAGLLRSFEPAVLGRADLHVGGAPARYDGGLTYILDLRTRRPRRDRLHASGSFDLLSGTAALDGPLGSHAGVVASARTLHNLGEAPLGASPYGYRDVLLALQAEPFPGQILRTTGFWNRESVVLDLPASVDLLPGVAPDEAWWSNRAASAAWTGHAGGLLLEATLAASGYEARLPLRPYTEQGAPTAAALLAGARTDRVRGGVEAARALSGGAVRLGVSWESVDASYTADPLETGATASAARNSSSSVGGYLEVTHALAPDVTLRAGGRVDRFSGDRRPRLAPRVALTWEVSPEAVVTVATGRYHQSTRASDVTVEQSLSQSVADTAAPANLLPVASADHVVVSFDQRLGDDVTLGIAGFWKSYRGLERGQTEPIRSSGVDLRVQRRGERATAWLGYDLSWYWSTRDLSGATSDFAGRQLLTAGMSGALGSLFGADVRVAYGGGLPYTSVPFRTSAPTALPDELGSTGDVIEQTPPLPGGLREDFLRVDVELNATFTPRWGGHRWEIEPYVRVLNALDRRDALFYAFQPWRDEALTPLAERPLVPVLGVAWRF
jgi:hypothetical protein